MSKSEPATRPSHPTAIRYRRGTGQLVPDAPRRRPARPPERAQVAAVGVLALRQPHTVAGVTGDTAVLYRGAEHLAQQPERVLDRRHAHLVGDHLRHPRPHRGRLHIDHSHVTPVRRYATAPGVAPCRGRSARDVALRRRPRCVHRRDRHPARLRRDISAGSELRGNLGVQPYLRVGLASERLGALLPAVVDIPCAPAHPTAMSGAGNRPDGAVWVARSCPKVVDSGPDIALHWYLMPSSCRDRSRVGSPRCASSPHVACAGAVRHTKRASRPPRSARVESCAVDLGDLPEQLGGNSVADPPEGRAGTRLSAGSEPRRRRESCRPAIPSLSCHTFRSSTTHMP